MLIAPVNEAITSQPYVHQVFNGSLWNKNSFKGPPTEEVEKAWYDIMKCKLDRRRDRRLVKLWILENHSFTDFCDV